MTPPGPRTRGPLARVGLAGVVLTALAAGAAGQTRPLLTETARVPALGTLTLETGFDWIADEPNFLTGSERDRWAGPLLRLAYVPAQDIEFDFEWAGFVGAVDDPEFGSAWDWGDAVLRAKWRFLERPSGLQLGARFQVALPQTEVLEGLGTNTLRFSAQLLGTRQAGPWLLHANAGLAIHDQIEEAGIQTDFLHYGLALERRLSPRWRLLGEVAGLAGAGSIGTEPRAEARLGARWEAGRAAWDAAVRRGLMEADGTWGLTVGLTLAIRSPGPPEADRERVPQGGSG